MYQSLYTQLKEKILDLLPEAVNRVFLPQESQKWTYLGVAGATETTPVLQIVDAQGLTLALSGAASTFALSFDVLGSRDTVEDWVTALSKGLFNHPRNPTPYTMISPPTPETLPDNKLRVRFLIRVTTKPEVPS